MREAFKVNGGWGEIAFRVVWMGLAYLLTLGALWLSSGDLQWGKGAVGVLISVAALWVFDPALQWLHDSAEDEEDDDVDVS